LRDQRQVLLSELSEIIDIKAVEQFNGSVTVFAGSDFLVFEGGTRDVEIIHESNNGLNVADILIKETKAPIQSSSGELAGLRTARDEILLGYLNDLDTFSKTLIFEFNKVFSSGQGLSAYDSVRSEFAIVDAQSAVDAAGLEFTPNNGAFEFHVINSKTGLRTTHDIFVRLNGLKDDTSIDDVIAELNTIDGIQASITPTQKFQILSDPDVQFTFGNDTSGLLAALGINTFFSGSGSSDINVAETIRNDPGKFAASQGGVGADIENALKLTTFQDALLPSAGNITLTGFYDQITANTAQSAAVAKSVAQGFRTFQRTLEGQKLATSGVSIDEEAIKMIQYQRAYQAAAKFITTVSDLLEVLIQL